MKQFKKLLAVALAAFVALAVATPAFAASITVTRDDSYAGTEDGSGRAYSYYKIFSAVKAEGADVSFDGGYEDDGTAVTEQGDAKVSYTATAAVAAKLADAGNLWFDVQDIAGQTDKVVTWKSGVQPTATNVQAAAAWLVANGAYESGPTALTFADGEWTSGSIDDGYYVIASDTGANLVAATSDITVKEKNDYPPIDKTQADEDAEEQGDAEVKLAIGDSVTYQAKVTIPKTAKVGDTMVVTDTPSKGLTYNNDVKVAENTGNATVAFGTASDDEAWKATITVTEGSQGKDVIFEYTMTINDDALVDDERVNTFTLDFGDNYTSVPEKVTYTTYFTGIEKIDGETDEPLEGVKFDLFEDGKAFNVTLTDDGYYIPGGSSNEVETDADGKIVIRGLDDDKDYTLTETYTLPGYNMLDEDVALTLVEDEGNVYTTTEFEQVKNNQGTVLPSTGGMGTTLFYVVGGLMVAGAAIALIAKNRVAKMEA